MAVWHRRRERCGTGQDCLETNPGAAPERAGRGDRTPVHCQAVSRPGPPRSSDGCVRDGTSVQLQPVPSAGRDLPLVRPRAPVLFQGLQRAVPRREPARDATALPARGEGPRDGPEPSAAIPDAPGGPGARGGQDRDRGGGRPRAGRPRRKNRYGPSFRAVPEALSRNFTRSFCVQPVDMKRESAVLRPRRWISVAITPAGADPGASGERSRGD